MRQGLRATAIGGLGILVALGAAACGSSGSHAAAGSSTGAAAVQTAYRTTSRQKTVAFRLDETSTAKSSGGSARTETVTGSGQADLASKSFTLTVHAAGVGNVRTVETGGTEYVQVPASYHGEIPGHKRWLSVNLNKVSQTELGASLSQLSAGGTNPGQELSELAGVSGTVSEVGTATVAGVPTTEYRATVNLDKLANQEQATAGKKAAQAIRKQAKQLGTSTLPVEVWVASNNLVRRIRVQTPVPTGTSGSGTSSSGTGTAGGTATATVTFTSFGEPVHITTPPASQTDNITNLVLKEAGSQSG